MVTMWRSNSLFQGKVSIHMASSVYSQLCANAARIGIADMVRVGLRLRLGSWLGIRITIKSHS